MSVRPSVCPSVGLTLVDQEHIGWKSWRLIARKISQAPSLSVAQPTPRGTLGNLRETRGGVGKSGVLEHKSGNMSETRKDGGKVTMEYGGPIGTHQRSFERYHPRPPTASYSSRLGFATTTKTSIAKLSFPGTGKVKFELYIHSVHPNKSPLG